MPTHRFTHPFKSFYSSFTYLQHADAIHPPALLNHTHPNSFTSLIDDKNMINNSIDLIYGDLLQQWLRYHVRILKMTIVHFLLLKQFFVLKKIWNWWVTPLLWHHYNGINLDRCCADQEIHNNTVKQYHKTWKGRFWTDCLQFSSQLGPEHYRELM